MTDPHAWQSLANGTIYVAKIVKGLAEADPANADYYKQSGAYSQKLGELDSKVKEDLASVPKCPSGNKSSPLNRLARRA